MELSNEILESVKRSLPGVHAEAMAEFIKNAKATEKQFDDYKKSYEKLNEEYKKEVSVRVQYESQVNLSKDILNREYGLKVAEQSLTLEKLKFDITKQLDELKVKSAEDRANSLYALIGIMMQNPQVIKTVAAHSDFGYYQNYVKDINGGNNPKWLDVPIEKSKISTETEQTIKKAAPAPGTLPNP